VEGVGECWDYGVVKDGGGHGAVEEDEGVGGGAG